MNIGILNKIILGISLFSTFSTSTMEQPDITLGLTNNTNLTWLFAFGDSVGKITPNSFLTTFADWQINPDTGSDFTKVAEINFTPVEIAGKTIKIKFLKDKSKMQVIENGTISSFDLSNVGFFFFKITINKDQSAAVKLYSAQPGLGEKPQELEAEEAIR
jgi:hypothetical protein